MISENIELSQKFETYCLSQNLGKLRILKYHYIIKSIDTLLQKKFKDVNEKDIGKLLQTIQAKYPSPYTRNDYRVGIRKFFKFIGKERLVADIKGSVKQKEIPLPEYLTREETQNLIETARLFRDKCLYATLFESGARIHELLSAKLSDLEFDSYGAILKIQTSKTKARRIRIVNKIAVNLLHDWVYGSHPNKDKPEAKIFPYSYKTLHKVFKSNLEKANIKKSVGFHAFRHGRSSELSQILTEAELDVFMGWEIGSPMPRIYVHLNDGAVEKKILQMEGVTKDQKLDKTLHKMKVKEPEMFRALMRFVDKEMEKRKRGKI